MTIIKVTSNKDTDDRTLLSEEVEICYLNKYQIISVEDVSGIDTYLKHNKPQSLIIMSNDAMFYCLETVDEILKMIND